ncbi:hypothetical protein MC885_016510 [Smutsia gigantea]|nr:hypothetical protein MC885_016510 [Smutsia gigantea]
MPLSKNKLLLLLGMICMEQGKSATLSLPKAPTCGWSLVKARPWSYFNLFSRIAGGSQVEKGSYSWQVSLKRRQKLICGGTIISPQWVITAAHCITNRNTALVLNVTAGEHDLSHTEPGEQVLTTETIIVHPYFSTKKPMDYDIALLNMAGTFHFVKHLRLPLNCLSPWPSSIGETSPVRLFSLGQAWGPYVFQSQGNNLKLGSSVQLQAGAAWLKVRTFILLIRDGMLPQVLQQVNLPILTQEECLAALLTLKKPISGRTFLCTGFPEGGRDACQCHALSRMVESALRGSCTSQKAPRSLRRASSELCVWTMLVPEKMHMLLSLSHLDAESCHHSYLAMYSLEDRLIGKFCGESVASSVLIGSSSVRLQLVSDATDHAAGFNLTCKALEPNYLPGNLFVIYPGSNMEPFQRSFQNLEIEESGDCTSDCVAVHRDVERKKEIDLNIPGSEDESMFLEMWSTI